jgi:hypothetical protein
LALPGLIERVPEARTVSVRVALPVPLPFVALSLTVYVPADVGVPEIKPVAALITRLAGRLAAA